MAVRTFVADFEDVGSAYKRVEAELEALDATALSPMNLDVVTAASVVLGVADGVLSYRARIAKLPEFDMVHIDKLVDYAKAVWFLHATNQPAVSAKEADALIKEAGDLRAKLLVWALPLVAGGHFTEEAVARVRDGGGFKDLASDLVGLVAMYRSKWETVGLIIGVTEQEIERAAQLGTAVFAIAAARENTTERPTADGSLRLRRAWTRLEFAYSEARRAIDYLRTRNVPLEEIVPNLRRNAGPGKKPATETEGTSPAPANPTPATPATPAAGGLGGGGSPFVKS